MVFKLTYGLLLSFVFLMVQCNKQETNPNRKVLAKVGERILYEDEITPMTAGLEPSDSASRANHEMEAWIRRSVVLEEAENKLKEDFDIDALVEDYRASLLLHNYRQQLVTTSLDTSISKEELSNFYEVSKDQYLLSEPIIRFKIAKFPSKTVGLDRFFQNWKKDKESTISFIEQNAIFSMVNEEKWHTLSELQSYLPEGFNEKKLSRPGDVQFYDDGEEYFVKIIEYIKEGDVPPLDYVKDKLSRVIINNKKKSLLADIERTLYQKYMASNKIKTYTK